MQFKDLMEYFKAEICQFDVNVYTIDNVMLDDIERNKLIEKNECIYSIFPENKSTIGVRLERTYKEIF